MTAHEQIRDLRRKISRCDDPSHAFKFMRALFVKANPSGRHAYVDALLHCMSVVHRAGFKPWKQVKPMLLNYLDEILELYSDKSAHRSR